MELLDNLNVLKQRDPQDALGVAAAEYLQLQDAVEVVNQPSEKRSVTKIVVAGMGGSALAANLTKDWLDLSVPFEVVKGYTLPKYIDHETLVIVSSYSGNTEETLSALSQAREAGAILAIIASGGELIKVAESESLTHVKITAGIQPRMAVFSNLVALIGLLEAYGVIHDVLGQLREAGASLGVRQQPWLPDVPTADNPAKQLALELAGKTPVIYASSLMASVAYKWKISFNENAKNIAFWNMYPEFNHNEFIGWSSHPVQKPYGIIDLMSSYDHERIKKRFQISDRLLSGKRPQSCKIELQGETVLAQMLWGSVMADFVSIYLAILNGVDPTPVDLIEKLKRDLQ